MSKRRKGGRLGDMLFADKEELKNGGGEGTEESLKEMLKVAKGKAAKLSIVE